MYEAAKRAVCIREVQNTIKDSVKLLLEDKIRKLGLTGAFEITEREIKCLTNGSLCIFRGMQNFNADNIKSLEGFDIAWVEEGQTLSQRSLDLLRPTIRKPGSELWFSWNPRFESDPVDKFFRGGGDRRGMICVEVGYQDNPWFPEVLRDEMEDDYRIDPEKAAHVWGGGYELITEANYYAKLISAAEREGRVGNFPHNPAKQVVTSWDIGVDDYTDILFWQEYTDHVRIVDFYEIDNAGIGEIRDLALPELNPRLAEAAQQMIELGRPEPFQYRHHNFPHDIKVREWGAGARQRSLTAMELGIKPIHPGVQTDPADRINAARKLLPLVYFNDTPRIRILINHLRRFSRKKNELLGVYTGPLHDDHIHAADAFGEYAINCPLVRDPAIETPKPRALPGQIYLPGPPEPRQPGRIRL
jgi:phage terminase large subunit